MAAAVCRQVGGGGDVLVVCGRAVRGVGLAVSAARLRAGRVRRAAALRAATAASAARRVPRPPPLRARAHAAGGERQLTAVASAQRTNSTATLHALKHCSPNTIVFIMYSYLYLVRDG